VTSYVSFTVCSELRFAVSKAFTGSSVSVVSD